jgi:hypothetical protein
MSILTYLIGIASYTSLAIVAMARCSYVATLNRTVISPSRSWVASIEDIPELSLSRLDQSIPGAEFILSPLDHFIIHGPNGLHQCLVLPLLRPPVSPNLWIRMRHDLYITLQKIARQAAQGLSYLRKSQICHRGI